MAMTTLYAVQVLCLYAVCLKYTHPAICVLESATITVLESMRKNKTRQTASVIITRLATSATACTCHLATLGRCHKAAETETPRPGTTSRKISLSSTQPPRHGS
eukprot:scaffold92514_cov28-Tisochrysis_lutea.AAC.1